MKNKMKLCIILSLILLASVFSCSDMMSVYLNSDGGSGTTDAAEAADALTEDDFTFTGADSRTSVTTGFTLPVSGSVTGTTISWASDNTSVISISGGTATVTQPSGSNVTVTLTATITDAEGNTTTKTFTVTVVAIVYFSPTTNMNADLVLGQTDFTSNTAPDPPSSSSLNQARGIAVIGSRLYMADTNNNRILGFNTIPTANGTAADFVLGHSDFVTRAAAPVSASAMSQPFGLSTNGTALAVADHIYNRVLIWNSAPASTNQAADVVVGQANMTSSGGATTQTGLWNPQGVFLTDNKLIVADQQNYRVLIYNSIPSADGAAADVVLGQTDFTSNNYGNPGTTASTLTRVYGLWSDGTKLLVSDSTNNRVLIWNSFPTANGQAADVVIGQPDMTGNTANNGGISADSLSAPQGLFVDTEGKLYISDYNNNRVLVFNSIPTTDNASADIVLGQADFTTGVAQGYTANSTTSPTNVFVTDTSLWVGSYFGNRVMKFE